MTSVLFVDDHPIVLQGCFTVLQDLGVEHILDASSVAAAHDLFLTHRPDVVILDLAFEGDELAGLSLIKHIMDAEPPGRVLIFSMHANPTIVSRALERGALGYVLKDAPSNEFAAAFAKVLGGAPYLSHKLATQVAMLRARGMPLAAKDLTSREAQILSLLGRGQSYEQIAAELGVSYKTVTNASSAMRSKLNIDSLAGLIRFALQNDPERHPPSNNA